MFNVGKNYEAVADMEAYLTILGSAAGLSDVTLSAKTLPYNGAAQSLAITGTLPKGVTGEYIGNGQTEIGTYTVTAKFYMNGEYIEGGDISATLKIVKADIDMSGVSFTGDTFEYDGEAKSIFIAGTLPAGVTVSYEGNAQSAAGIYVVTAKFAVADEAHYNTPADMSATLVINQGAGALEGISFESKTVTYNGLVHRIEIGGTLPEGYTVRYTNNAKSEAGTYAATAQFYFNGVYVAGADLGATLKIDKATIDMSGISCEGAEYIYDGEAKSIFITGTLPAGVTVSYEGNAQVGVGNYTVTAKFNVGNNYNAVADMTALLVINPDPKDVSYITFDGITVTYDGQFYSIYIVGELHAGVTVEYEGNNVKLVGTHTVIAKFYYNGEYI